METSAYLQYDYHYENKIEALPLALGLNLWVMVKMFLAWISKLKDAKMFLHDFSAFYSS